MLVLHGSWVASGEAHPAGFALWGEVSPERGATARRKKVGSGHRAGRVLRHPFTATVEHLAAALADTGEPSVAVEPATVLARLPSRDGAPVGSPELCRGVEGGSAPSLANWLIPALTVGAADAAAWLVSLDGGAARLDVVVGDDLRFWVAAARLALALVCRQRLRPTLEQDGAVYLARWRPQLDAEGDAERAGALARSMPPAGRALAWDADAAEPRPRELLRGFLEAAVDALARQARSPFDGAAGARPVRRASRRVGVAEAWLRALFGDPVVAGEPGELAAFYRAYR